MKARFTVVVMMWVSLSAFAHFGDDPQMVVRSQKDEGMYTLIYKGEVKRDLLLSIYDEVGGLLFREVIENSGGFMRTLNFTRIAEGDYFVEVSELEQGQDLANDTLIFSRQTTDKINHTINLLQLLI